MRNLPEKAYLVGYFKESERRNYVYCLFYERESAVRFITDANNDDCLGRDRTWSITTMRFMDF